VINGEKSSFNNSVFGKRRYRTIEAIIKTIYEKESLKVRSLKNLLELVQCRA
jgi:hypothetical protein